MKTNLIAAAAMSLIASAAEARDTVVALSPLQDTAAARGQVELVIGQLANALQPGERAAIFDVETARLIAELVVPEGAAYANPRARLQANAPALRALKAWFGAAQNIPGRTAQGDLPKLLREVAKHYPAGEEGADLIVLLNSIWDRADAPSLSMRGGRVLNDGFVAAGLDVSPVGTTGVAGTLKGYDVRMGLIGPDGMVSGAHAYAVERFWTLEVEALGGSMAFYGDDLNTLFRGAGEDAPNRAHPQPLEATDKLEVLSFQPDLAATAETPRRLRNAVLGISWSAQRSDLDLYVRAAPGAQPIFFGNPSTPEGALHKDLRDAPRGGFETVTLIGELDPAAIFVAVNHFGGAVPAGGLHGQLVVAWGEETRRIPFALTANGDRGAGREATLRDGHAASGAWAVIDLAAAFAGQ